MPKEDDMQCMFTRPHLHAGALQVAMLGPQLLPLPPRGEGDVKGGHAQLSGHLRGDAKGDSPQLSCHLWQRWACWL